MVEHHKTLGIRNTVYLISAKVILRAGGSVYAYTHTHSNHASTCLLNYDVLLLTVPKLPIDYFCVSGTLS